ncbi:N-acyl-D-aspartate/D-glutamate deacylase [Desulfosporosinus orientis DSM 765]|uniref:N-acyl-D-aspartate/D-glutamate deacylase n=1 Tax=Desulfosporosinus orientis (strain ATCC 19365 / DSM 765 / NCIMB 8382 / VKM B-1628 / Singapore I) TaxID=768706 RepID=G7WF14_DESOD|nr:amidohydrolase family protein [Desulfosporosinus orientis]AET67625.1 N-acyl-D-aspartate/D-glutamate deacylase [Desulfosporosinus orientis DSM 765]
MFDLVITGGTVIDGTGTAPYRGDIGIKDGRIAEIAQNLSSREAALVIDAPHKIIAPGFIDVHSHCDLVSFMSGPIRESRIRQGVTTEVIGQCGLGSAPHLKEMTDWRTYLAPILGQGPQTWDWPEFGMFLEELEQREKPNNMAALIGHGAVRAQVLGLNNIQPSAEQITAMSRIVENSMAQGALGISYGLAYLPGMFAPKEELTALSSVVADYNGIMMIHIRSHSRQVRESMAEALAVAKESGVKLQISHMRSYANRDFGISAEELMTMVDKTRDQGVNVTFDEHPYRAGSTLLSQILPPWAKEGGSSDILHRLKDPQLRAKIKADLREQGPDYPGWDNFVGMVGWSNIMISSVSQPENKWMEGKTAAQLVPDAGNNAEAFLSKVIDTLSELLISENCRCSMVMQNLFSEEDIIALLKHPLCQIGSDGIPTGKPHPRLFGTYPKFLGEYVRDKKTLTWSEGIKRITGDPALRLNLPDRGFLRTGYQADIVVFDPDKIKVQEDYTNPSLPPEGIDYTLINGQIALSKGEILRTNAGTLIRR